MRDYRNAKAMAQTLRQALSEKQPIALSHSESLELIARILGFRDWNVLAAKIAADESPATSGPKTLHCSFCGKSQHDVAKLIAGPDVFICDECVGLCDDILLAENVTPESVDAMSAEELIVRSASATKWLDRARKTLSLIDLIADGNTALADTVRLGGRAAQLQHAFIMGKSPYERRAYAGQLQERVVVMERVVALTTALIRQGAAPLGSD